jgi:hypothetical protein
MTPYLYAPIQMRSLPVVGEWRDVAVLLAEHGGGRHVELARAPLRRVVSGLQADVAGEVMDDLEQAAQHMQRPFHTSAYPTLVDWWRARAGNREDFVRLAPPRPGVAEDIRQEAKRVLTEMTGYRAEKRPRSAVQQAIRTVIAEGDLREAFREGTLRAGELEFLFSRLWRRREKPVCIQGMDFERETRADKIVHRAGRLTTELAVLRRHDTVVDTIAVSAPPREPALRGVYRDATSLLQDAGVTVLDADPDQLRRALVERGAPIAA